MCRTHMKIMEDKNLPCKEREEKSQASPPGPAKCLLSDVMLLASQSTNTWSTQKIWEEREPETNNVPILIIEVVAT